MNMPTAKVIIRTKDDHQPAFPEITTGNFLGEGELYGISILEHGMQSGKTSIGLVIQMQDGKYVMAQTSALILEMIYHALQSAEQRFADIKIKKQ